MDDRRNVDPPAIKIAKLSNGPHVPYVEQGGTSGVPMVCLHGFADSWRSFELVLPQISRSVHAFAFTQGGHGEATRPEEGYAVDDFAQDLAAFMDAVGVEKGVIVGHSMGSAIARRFAIDHPDRTLGLVLVGASATSLGTREAREYWDAQLAKLTDPVDEQFIRQLVEETVIKPLPQTFMDTLVQESQKTPAYVWRAAIEARWRSEEHVEDLTRISAPTLICWGELDPRYPRGDQETLLKLISGSRLVVFPDCGHALHWEEPERFGTRTSRLRPKSQIGNVC